MAFSNGNIECRDPVSNPILGVDLNFPSNTFYPVGTICAKDYTRLSCFTTGDSGSPLMIKQSDTRFYTEGILREDIQKKKLQIW